MRTPAALRGLFFLLVITIVACRPQITVIGERSSNLEAIAEQARQFEEETGIRVNIAQVNFDRLQEFADADLANGTGEYDVILQYNFSLSPYVSNGWVIDYEELLSRAEATISDPFGAMLNRS